MKSFISRNIVSLRSNIINNRHYSKSNVSNSIGNVGFIGLGNMGNSMAKNLLTNAQVGGNGSSKVVVYDINKESVDKLVAQGAIGATSVANLASQCQTIFTMLPATAHVKKTLLGEAGVFANAQKGALIVDSSTIDPLASRELIETAENHGHVMIDAPVSGGVTGAAAGTLTFMVGGSEATLERARVFLSAMGKNIVHCGGPGAGEITKLCNNLALAISMIGTSEAMSLGVRMGLDAKKLAGVMNTSTARCWSSDTYNPVPGIIPNVPSSRGYTGGFGVGLIEKDLSLAMEVASASKSRLPLGGQAHQLYGLLCEHGYGDKDFSVVYEFLTKSMKK